MVRNTLASTRALFSVLLALSLALGWTLAVPLSAFGQGEWPRCPGAPFRFPSGNWIWYSYTAANGGNHGGVDLVDRSLEYTTTASRPLGSDAHPPYFEGNAYGDALAFPSGRAYPENTIPVYAPIAGQFNAIQSYRGFPGSALLTATLDSVFSQTVPTRNISIWFTHMSNFSGTVSYITHPTGPINEGDLIGYQGQGNTFPVHLHFEIDDGSKPNRSIDPSTYLGAPVSGPDNASAHYYAIACTKSPVGYLDQPAYNAAVQNQATISGWVIDPPSLSDTGIDQVELYADGFKGGSGIYLGAPSYGQARSDIAQAYGSRFLNSGYSFDWYLGGVSSGRHSLNLYAHQVSTNQWLLMDVRFINVNPFIYNFFFYIPFVTR